MTQTLDTLKDTAVIDLCVGTNDEGQKIYVYTKVTTDRYAAYKDAAFGSDIFDPEDYGEIIAQGFGTPPVDLITRLKKEYAFWDGFEDAMIEANNAIMKTLTEGSQK